MFYDNFVSYCNNVKKSPSAVASELGLSRASVNGWKHGKIPTDANQIKIAQYFGVSVTELMSEQKEKPAQKDEPDITFNDFTYALHNENDFFRHNVTGSDKLSHKKIGPRIAPEAVSMSILFFYF